MLPPNFILQALDELETRLKEAGVSKTVGLLCPELYLAEYHDLGTKATFGGRYSLYREVRETLSSFCGVEHHCRTTHWCISERIQDQVVIWAEDIDLGACLNAFVGQIIVASLNRARVRQLAGGIAP